MKVIEKVLFQALCQNRLDVFGFIICNARIDMFMCRTPHGNTFLHVMAFLDLPWSQDVIEALLKTHKLDINSLNADHQTPLHCVLHNVDMARFLVRHGADVDRPDKNGYTPYTQIPLTRDSEQIKHLVEDIEYMDIQIDSDPNTDGWAYSELIDFFVDECKVVPHQLDPRGDNILTRFSGQTNMQNLSLVVDHLHNNMHVPIQPEIGRDEDSPGTLKAATLAGNTDVLRFFHSKCGYLVDQFTQFLNALQPTYTLLEYALLNNQLDTARFILEQGGDMNINEAQRMEPFLHTLVCRSSTESVRFLIEKCNYNMYIKNKYGQDVFQLSTPHSSSSMFKANMAYMRTLEKPRLRRSS